MAEVAERPASWTGRYPELGTGLVSYEVRAFHNVCRHRGNKLVWDTTPRDEASGFCRQFMCKYHGWRYGLDGELKFVLQEEEFFDFDKSNFPLVAVHCEVWDTRST